MKKQMQRQVNALDRLQNQLNKGTKPLKENGKTTSEVVQLSEKDKSRINKEIEILTSKINKY